MPEQLTADQRAAKVRRITAMLEKVNRPESDASVTAEERVVFRAKAEEMMSQYGIKEEECRPVTRASSTDWMSSYFNDLFRQAAQNAAQREREEHERQRQARAHRLLVTRQILDEMQREGQAFVPDELIVSMDYPQTIGAFLATAFAGWEIFTERDHMRAGYWIRNAARDAEHQEQVGIQREKSRKAKEQAEERLRYMDEHRWRKMGTTDEGFEVFVDEGEVFGVEDEPIIDELGDYLDGVNEELKARRFDHRFCSHEKTQAARRKCRASREGQEPW